TQQSTQTAKFRCAKWASPHLPLTLHIIHHLALNIVGKKLTDFESSCQLILAVHDALIGTCFSLHTYLIHNLSTQLTRKHSNLQRCYIETSVSEMLSSTKGRATSLIGTWQS
ncbi:hypothetical protein BDR06DRAFT_868966, partial [Suillus hirtellus]